MRDLRWVAVLLACACAEPSGTAPAPARVPSYDTPIVLFVRPDPEEIRQLHQRLGDEAFYVTADDAMWYRAAAVELLDSLRIPHTEVQRGEAWFRVRGESRLYGWRQVDLAWFLVLYDGENEPRISASVDLYREVHRLTRRDPR